MNYDYQKARVVSFLKSLDNKTWKAVINRLTLLKVTAEENTKTFNIEKYWSKKEDKGVLDNYHTFNADYNGINKNIFENINTFTSAKEAWETLETCHEGTFKVCMSTFQLLTMKFENQKVKEDETIVEFNVQLHDISISSFSLGNKISEEKMASTNLRCLPKSFDMKW